MMTMTMTVMMINDNDDEVDDLKLDDDDDDADDEALWDICMAISRLLPKKILKGPSELNDENLGAQHMK